MAAPKPSPDQAAQASRAAAKRAEHIIVWTVLAVLFGLGVFLVVMATLVRHVQDIKAHPGRFCLEVLLVCAGAAIPYAIIALMRRASLHRLLLDTTLLTVKLAIAWVLFEISGFNMLLFPERMP